MWWYAVLLVSAGASDRGAGLRRWISRHGRVRWRHESTLRIGSFGLRDVRRWSLGIHVVRGFFLCFSSVFLQAVQEGIFLRLDLFLRLWFTGSFMHTQSVQWRHTEQLSGSVAARWGKSAAGGGSEWLCLQVISKEVWQQECMKKDATRMHPRFWINS